MQFVRIRVAEILDISALSEYLHSLVPGLPLRRVLQFFAFHSGEHQC